MTVELVIAGNLLVDDLVFADGRTHMGEPGGAVLHAALAARLWETRVGCASICGTDYPARARQALLDRGIDLEGVKELGRAGIRTWLLYEDAGRRMVPRLGGPSHAAMSPTPEQLPASYWQARAFHLAPMPLDCQHKLAAQLRQREMQRIAAEIGRAGNVEVRISRPGERAKSNLVPARDKKYCSVYECRPYVHGDDDFF